MSEHISTAKRYESLILASRRRELMPVVIALLGLDQDRIEFFDPEQPYPESDFKAEPDGADPFEAVQFKLNRVLEFFKLAWNENKDFILYASDVVFSANGQHTLKPSRVGENINLEIIQQELFERYQKPFLAEWNIAFGVADKSGVNMGNIRIEADYPGLTKEEISEYFSPDTNPGLEMAELGLKKDISFRLFLAEDEEPLILDPKDDCKLVLQFIVQKLPTEEMFENLLRREMAAEAYRYGLIVQGFLTTMSNSYD